MQFKEKKWKILIENVNKWLFTYKWNLEKRVHIERNRRKAITFETKGDNEEKTHKHDNV